MLAWRREKGGLWGVERGWVEESGGGGLVVCLFG